MIRSIFIGLIVFLRIAYYYIGDIMSQEITKKYGFWGSEISAKMVAGKALKFSGLESTDDSVFWSESRPDEGRNVIVKRGIDGKLKDIIKAPFSAMSRVHEYGGGEFGLGLDILVFVNAKDQDLYSVDLDGETEPKRLTNIINMRFADIQILNGQIIAVAECHGAGMADNMPENLLVRLDLNSDAVTDVEVIAEAKNNGGRDFYCYPRISPCGTKIAFMVWDLPFMPWQNAEIILADLNKRGIENAQAIVGGGKVAAFAPSWGNACLDGSLADLYYISDQTGYGNLYRYQNEKRDNLFPIAAECGHPNWVFAMRSFDILSNGHIVVRLIEDGVFKLALVDPLAGKANMIDTAFRYIDKITAIGDGVAAFVTTDDQAEMLVLFAPWASNFGILRQSNAIKLAKDDISKGKIFKYNVANGAHAYAIYYPPKNANYGEADGELPPIIVKAHGGPTAFADRGFKLKYQYWTNRGFGLVDLDYRGSFGYGRNYVEQLDGNWGISDVEDAVAAVKHLGDIGKIDVNKAFITGGSAGGYTVLMALAMGNDFLAGSSYFGVADLGGLAKFTHKFELKYMDDLVGLPMGLNQDEIDAFFFDRSPLSKLENYSSPTLFLQGMDDKVVLPEQSQAMYDALKAKGIETKLIMYEGEGHGFKKAENNINSLNEELAFYQKLL